MKISERLSRKWNHVGIDSLHALRGDATFGGHEVHFRPSSVSQLGLGEPAGGAREFALDTRIDAARHLLTQFTAAIPRLPERYVWIPPQPQALGPSFKLILEAPEPCACRHDQQIEAALIEESLYRPSREGAYLCWPSVAVPGRTCGGEGGIRSLV